MARGYGFEPGERYILDGVGYEIVSELSGEEVVVRNLFTQRKQSAGRQQLRDYWHEGRLWFGIKSGGEGEVEVRTHWKVVDMSCVSAEVQEETWDRYRVLEPLLEEYGDGRVPEERIADRIREYVEEQERRLVRGERTGRVFGGHGKAGEKEEKAGLVCVRSVQRWMRMFERSGRDIRSLVPGYAQRGKRGMKLSKEVEEVLRTAVERVYLRRERAPVTHVIDEVRAMIAEKNAIRLEGEAALEMPSRTSIYRYIERLDPEEVDTARFGKWMARQKHQQVEQGPRPERPNERWELDHTLLDVVVIDEEDGLPIGRPTLTAVRDKYSGCIPGFALSFEPPCAQSVLDCLLYAIPEKTQVQKHFGLKYGYVGYGVPETLVVDQRTIADLPSTGQHIRVLISARRFFCDVAGCPRKIFVERLTPFVEPWARVTARLFSAVQAIGFATGGMLGARLAKQLGIQTSWMTILRRMMARPTAPAGYVSELGIDDFSFKRGRTFGTILVDMQSHQVVDLLPDRKAKTARSWITNHPEIALVSRDRGGDYASAATAGAPQAVQCADRFHVLKNLEETVEGLLAHHLAVQRKHQAQERRSEAVPVWQSKRTPLYGPKLRQLQQARREERRGCYENVVALRRQGFSHQAIAEHVGVSHATVQRWLASDTFPEKKPREQGSHLDRYLPYLHERWNEGCHNMAHLFRELVEQGYKGSYASVRDTLLRLLPEGRKTPSGSLAGKRAPLLSRQAAFLFLRQPEKLEAEEQETLTYLRQLHPEIDVGYELVQQFTQMLRTRTGEHLDEWLEKVRASQIRLFQSFVSGIERDKAAVVAGLTLSQNNDHVA